MSPLTPEQRALLALSLISGLGPRLTRSLLERNPNPTEDEIRHELEGNICRCTGYQNIVRAVQYAAETMAAGGND